MMNILRRLITSLGGAGQSPAGGPGLPSGRRGEGAARCDAMWDEVLMASMQSEAPQMFLEWMGPRAR